MRRRRDTPPYLIFILIFICPSTSRLPLSTNCPRIDSPLSKTTIFNFMGEPDLIELRKRSGIAAWRLRLAEWVESPRIQHFIIGVILFNAVILGLETDRNLMAIHGKTLLLLDKLCLVIFCAEIAVRLLAYRFAFWKSGWNVFDFAVVAIALVPGAGPWAVLRSLRVLRVMRLLTVVPTLRRVVAAFLHAIPGLSGVMLLMAVFLYTSAVLATNLFGQRFPEWFGSLGGSLFSLFQILTLEGWADIARAVRTWNARERKAP